MCSYSVCAIRLVCSTLLAWPCACLDSRGRTALSALPRTVEERGYHGHETCESPILAQPKQERDGPIKNPFLLCVPYKNGWEWWSTTICDSEYHGNACHGDYHKKTQALDYLWWRHSALEIADAYRDITLPKIKLVRNPLTRVLSAWLTWVAKNQPGDYNYVEEDFGDFLKHSMGQRLNCHWSRQTRHCGEDEGVEYELLKVEERHLWGNRILQRFDLLAAARVNGGIRTEVREDCPGHECSATPLMTKYYTPELVQLVKAYYAEEIFRYNYTEEFRMWEDRIAWAFEDSRRTQKHEAIAPGLAEMDMNVLDVATSGFTDVS
mmetsp:Transcript_76543/g.224671  ORF Transcript_76543/g.224671 Transcript_76543/m.224671 type:complete len:322 (+) Transcript_76543:94-1059(+)